ncbi:hypothetical protein SLS57_003137 [Botryosphaeria dothidea]
MDPFEQKFGEFNSSEQKREITATQLAFLNSFPLLTYAVFLFVAARVGELYGRRSVLILMQLTNLAGLITAYTSTTFRQQLAGRMTYNAAAGMAVWLFPLTQAEIVPGAIRGVMVTLYALNRILGAFVSGIVVRFTSDLEHDGSWRIPLVVTVVFPCVVITLSPLLPESPRWLLRQGRFVEAAASLQWLHGCYDEYDAEAEAHLLQKSLEEAGAAKATGPWRDLLHGVNKMSGIALVSSYGTIFFKEVGGFNPFSATLIRRGISVFSPITTMLLVERVPRRKMFVSFATLAAAALLTMGGLGCANPLTLPIRRGIMSMLLFLSYVRMCGFSANANLIVSEVSHLSLREKTSFIYWSMYNLTEFVSTFTIPYLMKEPYANLQSRVGLIYGSVTAVGVVWIFMCVPDLRGRSLEEVEEMFRERVPARKTRCAYYRSFGNSNGFS